MGSPAFATPALQRLAERYDVVGVVTQPDRPAGRGREMTPPPVKDLAGRLGIPVFQPESLRTPEAFERIRDWAPDVIVVTAFGQILRKNILDLPRQGCINIHGSILPRWRGASPVQAAILAGDTETGVTIMKMDTGVDTGAILATRRVAILATDTADTLGKRLAETGADLLIETLPGYLAGKLSGQPQDESLATYAGLIRKEEGLLDFSQPAETLERRIRAFNPWPSTWFFWRGQSIKVHAAHVLSDNEAVPGKRKIISGAPAIGTSTGWLVLDEIQPAGKKRMSGETFLHGVRGWESEDAHAM
ncbi:MAG: methionyl-tRNA formyltransferase [Anaerolineae bacterium]|nr:methionyl-tRNA formyltransferase [Anaerolineae bacterium]